MTNTQNKKENEYESDRNAGSSLDRGGSVSDAAHHPARQTQSDTQLERVNGGKVNWKVKQNPDGGWAYSRGRSWTEPTAFVLLAQSAAGADGDRESVARGFRFLHSMAAPDGGFRPQASVDESTWVTAVAALLPEEMLGSELSRLAVKWLKGQTGRESSWGFRLRRRLAGNKDAAPEGWPWFPGAAAWVIPTSLGILAFERVLRRRDDSALRERVESGKDFLFTRMCADGGWNHGTGRALGVDGGSYPETTGIALLALRGTAESARLQRARAAAVGHLRTCRSAESKAWLRMALAVHGAPTESSAEEPAGEAPVCRTVLDSALTAIAAADVNPLLG